MNINEKVLQRITLFLAVVAVAQVMILLIPVKNYPNRINREPGNSYEAD